MKKRDKLKVVADQWGDRRIESEFRATGPVQQSTAKVVTKRLPHVLVKWFPTRELHRLPKKKEGGGKEVTDRRPFSEGIHNPNILNVFIFLFDCYVVICLQYVRELVFLAVSCDHMFGSTVWKLLFGHFATT